MKTIYRILTLVSLACLWSNRAQAQTSYTITTQTQGQDLRIQRGRLVVNEETCRRQGRTVGCTQAEACTPTTGIAPCPGGASCTPAQARACNARIYPATQGGLEEMLLVETVVPGLQLLKIRGLGIDAAAYCETWWPSATLAERHADCVKIGRGANSSVANPCDACP